jgi:hypothetical protein
MPRQRKFQIHEANEIFTCFLLTRPNDPNLPALTLLREVVQLLQGGQGVWGLTRESFHDAQVGDLIFEVTSEDASPMGLTNAALQCINQQIENWYYDQDMIRWEQYVEGMVLIDYRYLH